MLIKTFLLALPVLVQINLLHEFAGYVADGAHSYGSLIVSGSTRYEDRLCKAKRYERSFEQQNTRTDHYKRKLRVKTGEMDLQIPKLRHVTFETAIIELYRRRESAVEEASIKICLAGVCGRRAEDI